MNHESTISTQSKTHEGVSFIIRKVTEGLRVQIRLKLAGALARLRDIESEREEFFERLKVAYNKPLDQIKRSELTIKERHALDGYTDRIELINDSEVYPAYLAEALVSVSGIEIDGVAATAESLRNSGPPALYSEVIKAIMAEAGLSGAEKENLGSPTTSGAVVVGKESNTSASSVSV